MIFLNDKEKKQVPLRITKTLWNDLSAWADDEFRSLNGQIEYLLTECVKRRKNNTHSRADAGGRVGDGGGTGGNIAGETDGNGSGGGADNAAGADNGGADNSNADNAAAGSGSGGADIGAVEDDL